MPAARCTCLASYPRATRSWTWWSTSSSSDPAGGYAPGELWVSIGADVDRLTTHANPNLPCPASGARKPWPLAVCGLQARGGAAGGRANWQPCFVHRKPRRRGGCCRYERGHQHGNQHRRCDWNGAHERIVFTRARRPVRHGSGLWRRFHGVRASCRSRRDGRGERWSLPASKELPPGPSAGGAR